MFRRGQKVRPPVTRTLTFPAPSSGWVQSGNITTAAPDQAEVLDNFIPTAQGARLRGGSSEFADIGASVVRLFTYASGATEKLFATSATAIFDAEDVAGGSLRTTTSGDWSTVQISTAGGEFLVGVNGADTGFTYNGSTFSDISLTGVASTALSQVWLFKERLFFVEEGTQSAWFLPVESIGGTVSEINLGSIFQKGGNLLFGATWSLDSGSGLDDVCIFVSSRGEIAVYEGTDPASASTWSLVGVYDIGKPLNKHGFFKAGGDLAILTEDGIIPVSEALRKDRAALQAVAITYPIEDAWRAAIAERTADYPISATLWQSKTLLLVGTPGTADGSPVSFAAYARTGAWCRIIGWEVRCSAVYADELYFGTSAGKVIKADTGGSDSGLSYTAYYVPKFAGSEVLMHATAANVITRASDDVLFDLYAHADYQVDDMPAPLPYTVAQGSTWGTGVWGEFIWGAGNTLETYNNWQSVRAVGYSLAPGLAVTTNTGSEATAAFVTDESGNFLSDESGNLLAASGTTSVTVGPKVDFEILVTRLRYETGYAL